MPLSISSAFIFMIVFQAQLHILMRPFNAVFSFSVVIVLNYHILTISLGEGHTMIKNDQCKKCELKFFHEF